MNFIRAGLFVLGLTAIFSCLTIRVVAADATEMPVVEVDNGNVEVTVDVDNKNPKNPTVTDGGATVTGDGTITGSDDVTIFNDTKANVLTLDEIADLAKKDEWLKAEKEYSLWTRFWDEESLFILQQIERSYLVERYSKGKFSALAAMVRCGDGEATLLMRGVIADEGKELSTEDYASAIKILGDLNDKLAVNSLRLALYNKDSRVVTAALDTLGIIGDLRTVPELPSLIDIKNIDVSIHAARALDKMGEVAKVKSKFGPQVNFPDPATRVFASVMLYSIGDFSKWNDVKEILAAKTPGYYPAILSIIGQQRKAESEKAIRDALLGGEDEQLAAIDGIDALPANDVEQTLLAVERSKDYPVSVRIAAFNALIKRQSNLIGRDIWDYATETQSTSVPQELKVAAIIGLPSYKLLNSQKVRSMLMDESSLLSIPPADADNETKKQWGTYLDACRAALMQSATIDMAKAYLTKN
ncbi:MAG: hypothetical protein WCO98_12105 [bacterium]